MLTFDTLNQSDAAPIRLKFRAILILVGVTLVVALLAGHTGSVYNVSFSPDGSTLATGSVDGAVLL